MLQDELAEQTLKAMCRKFSSSAKIWMRQITWLLSKHQPDAVKRTLDKAFSALPQRKHIKVQPILVQQSLDFCLLAGLRHEPTVCSLCMQCLMYTVQGL